MDTQRGPATRNGPDGAEPGPERPRLTVAVLTYLRNAYLSNANDLYSAFSFEMV